MVGKLFVPWEAAEKPELQLITRLVFPLANYNFCGACMVEEITASGKWAKQKGWTLQKTTISSVTAAVSWSDLIDNLGKCDLGMLEPDYKVQWKQTGIPASIWKEKVVFRCIHMAGTDVDKSCRYASRNITLSMDSKACIIGRAGIATYY